MAPTKKMALITAMSLLAAQAVRLNTVKGPTLDNDVKKAAAIGAGAGAGAGLLVAGAVAGMTSAVGTKVGSAEGTMEGTGTEVGTKVGIAVGGMAAGGMVGAGIAVATTIANDTKHCKKTVDVSKPLDDFTLEDFISKPWYSQKQNEQQYQKKDSMACTSASYFKNKGCGFNVSNVGGVAEDYSYASAGGTFKANNTVGFLCARKVKNIPNGLEVMPCAICLGSEGRTPNYSVIHYDKDKGAAIVIGGQPNARATSGEKKCTFSSPTMSGMWIFTRQRERDRELVDALVQKMDKTFNLDTSGLIDVNQENCGQFDDVVKEVSEKYQ